MKLRIFGKGFNYSQDGRGIIPITAETLIKLADYYQVSVDYLLDRTDDPSK